MKEYLRNQKITLRKKKPSKLVIAAIAGGLLATAGLISYLTNSPYETISEKRARYLEIANEQLIQAQDSATSNALNKIITDIENGVYDY